MCESICRILFSALPCLLQWQIIPATALITNKTKRTDSLNFKFIFDYCCNVWSVPDSNTSDLVNGTSTIKTVTAIVFLRNDSMGLLTEWQNDSMGPKFQIDFITFHHVWFC